MFQNIKNVEIIEHNNHAHQSCYSFPAIHFHPTLLRHHNPSQNPPQNSDREPFPIKRPQEAKEPHPMLRTNRIRQPYQMEESCTYPPRCSPKGPVRRYYARFFTYTTYGGGFYRMSGNSVCRWCNNCKYVLDPVYRWWNGKCRILWAHHRILLCRSWHKPEMLGAVSKKGTL